MSREEKKKKNLPRHHTYESERDDEELDVWPGDTMGLTSEPILKFTGLATREPIK